MGMQDRDWYKDAMREKAKPTTRRAKAKRVPVDLLDNANPPTYTGLFISFAKPCSYFVTELLGTDLHRLLTSRPLDKQFIQYFLYQILVCSFLLAEIPLFPFSSRESQLTNLTFLHL